MTPIDPALLATVTGGNIQWHPALAATLEGVTRKPRTNKPDPRMQQAVTAIGTAMTGVTNAVSQAGQQNSQAMMQMLPQMMRR